MAHFPFCWMHWCMQNTMFRQPNIHNMTKNKQLWVELRLLNWRTDIFIASGVEAVIFIGPYTKHISPTQNLEVFFIYSLQPITEFETVSQTFHEVLFTINKSFAIHVVVSYKLVNASGSLIAWRMSISKDFMANYWVVLRYCHPHNKANFD